MRIMKVANYTDNDGSQLYGYGRWPTIRRGQLWKLANYTDMEVANYADNGRPTIRIWKVANYTDNWKVANYTDNESGQLSGY